MGIEWSEREHCRGEEFAVRKSFPIRPEDGRAKDECGMGRMCGGHVRRPRFSFDGGGQTHARRSLPGTATRRRFGGILGALMTYRVVGPARGKPAAFGCGPECPRHIADKALSADSGEPLPPAGIEPSPAATRSWDRRVTAGTTPASLCDGNWPECRSAGCVGTWRAACG